MGMPLGGRRHNTMRGFEADRTFVSGNGVFGDIAVAVIAVVSMAAAYASLNETPETAAVDHSIEATVDGQATSLALQYPVVGTDPARQKTSLASVATPGDPIAGDVSSSARQRYEPDAPVRLTYAQVAGDRVTINELCAADPGNSDTRCASASTGTSGVLTTARDNASSQKASGKTIAGRLLDEDGLGIEGVKVTAIAERTVEDRDGAEAETHLRRTTTSVAGGYYAFHDLPDGNYRIQTSDLGEYRSAWRSVRAGLLEADLVLVTDRKMAVRGQVLDEDGQPLEGVMVLPNMVGLASTTTDRHGHYRLALFVQPDTTDVRLTFRSAGFVEKTVPLRLPVSIDPLEPVLDVVMTDVDSWTTVTGSVVDTDGEALPGRVVQLQAIGQRASYRVTTDEEGVFVFDAVEAGLTYRLAVLGGPGFPDYSRHVWIDVKESEFHVALEPFSYGEVSGRLVNLEGAPIPDFTMTLRNAASRSPNATLSSDDEGRFAIDRAPLGELYFSTRASPSMLVRGVRLEAGDELHVPLVLDWGQHEIRGLVVDQRGSPVSGSEITLTWSHDSDGLQSSSVRRTTSDAQGNFVFKALGPGPHRLQIESPGRPVMALNHDVRKQGYDLTIRMN
jgi:protocatechuate 3,4-dioxygenase beta subunit